MELKSLKNIEEKLTFNRGGVKHYPLNFWKLKDEQYISIYQGNRGENPELDFVVKYRQEGKKLRGPSHTHWIVDLLIKSENNKLLVKEFVDEWLIIYDIIDPFKDKEQRVKYELVYSDYFNNKYFTLNSSGSFNVEFISILLELFIKCEKQTKNAYMFKNLLTLIRDYCLGMKDFYQVISYSKRT